MPLCPEQSNQVLRKWLIPDLANKEFPRWWCSKETWPWGVPLGGNDQVIVIPQLFLRDQISRILLDLILQARKPMKKPHWFRNSLKGFVITLMRTHVYPIRMQILRPSALSIWVRNHRRAFRASISPGISPLPDTAPTLKVAWMITNLKVYRRIMLEECWLLIVNIQLDDF